MNLYAVRQIKDQQPVGFFWCGNVPHLAFMADAVTPADGCEYKLVTVPTAIMWEAPVDWKMGVADPAIVAEEAAMEETDDCHLHEARHKAIMDGLTLDSAGLHGGEGHMMLDFLLGEQDIVGWTALTADDLEKGADADLGFLLAKGGSDDRH